MPVGRQTAEDEDAVQEESVSADDEFREELGEADERLGNVNSLEGPLHTNIVDILDA